ncbi:MAG: hypothetical protein AAFQ58_00870 [Pseudomonadota bacterium]
MSNTPRMPDRDEIDTLLDDLAKQSVPDPSDDLVARVLADAEAYLPPPGAVTATVPWWRQIVPGIGGWGAVGGLLAATVAGFVIGLGALDPVGADALWSFGYVAYYDADLGLDAFGWALEGG